jgi:GNAT superfamily N-acetyltransferase
MTFSIVDSATIEPGPGPHPAVIRTATEEDTDFLLAHDRHVEPHVLTRVVGDGRALVLEEEGEVRGWLRWSLFWDELPFLNMLFLLEGNRGRALGSKLLDEWERSMFADGHSRVLTSTASDERSQNLYRRRGYLDSGVLLLPGEVAELLLTKALDSAPR